MDFTLSKYRSLLAALKSGGYEGIVPGRRDINLAEGPAVLLRHDVDKRPERSLKTARIEAEMGFRTIYYFRAGSCSWNEEVVKEISSLGHGIGYHYECLTTCCGDIEAAWKDFQDHLARMRTVVPISSICMHGSPRSRWDSKDLWKTYDYHTLGVTYEPYLDTDFSRVFYLTDTGRRWDGWKVSVRDKIAGHQDTWTSQGLVFHSTDDIIEGITAGGFPERLMITTHPQRWTDSAAGWLREVVAQTCKNIVKGTLISLRQVFCK